MNRIEEAGHIRALFQRCTNDYAAQLGLVTKLRDVAIEVLKPVFSTIPRPMSEHIRKAYEAKGMSLAWNLTTTDAYEFCSLVGDSDPTPSLRSAAALLSACTEALEKNTVTDRLMQNILDAYIGLEHDALEKGDRFTHTDRQPKTQHIYELAISNPKLSAKALYAMANKAIIGDMSIGRFNNVVSEARQKLKK